MIFKFFKKQKEISTKKLLLKELIIKMDIPEKEKKLFLESIKVVSHKNLNNIYNNITTFIEKHELKQIYDIEKSNFISIDGMTKKEAVKKRREINAINFLFTNL